jgi:hypothetical protein
LQHVIAHCPATGGNDYLSRARSGGFAHQGRVGHVTCVAGDVGDLGHAWKGLVEGNERGIPVDQDQIEIPAHTIHHLVDPFGLARLDENIAHRRHDHRAWFGTPARGFDQGFDFKSHLPAPERIHLDQDDIGPGALMNFQKCGGPCGLPGVINLAIMDVDENLEELVCRPGRGELLEMARSGIETGNRCPPGDERDLEPVRLQRPGEGARTHQMADAKQVLHIEHDFRAGAHDVAFGILSP